MTTHITAADLTDRHVKARATIRVGDIEGRLHGIYPVRDRINLVLEVGGATTIWPLDAGAVVEVLAEVRR